MDTKTKIVLELLKNNPISPEAVNAVKRRILRSHSKSKNIPSSAELLKSYHKLVLARKIKRSPLIEKLLIKRAVRTLSGVAIITVLTKPFPCPGKCVYCPTEKNMPKSYLADEPAANRALNLQFDPYQQVKLRIKALEDNGHPTDKIELIVKGGTWNAYPLDYQYWFILRCFEAANKYGNSITVIPTECRNERRNPFNYKRDFSTSPSASLEMTIKNLPLQQKKNEKAKHRIIGLTLETRPDFINEKTIWQMRELGCTRIELGAQTTDDKILRIVKRGHNSEETKRATKLLKNYGFKVDYHLMPQLPGSTPAKDLKMMLEIFDNPGYRPDMIKVYPCTVVKNSELYQWLKRGEYKTYSDRKLIEILKKFKTKVPRYVRISRLIRDIPSHHIQAGNKMTNLRQVIQAEMAAEGLKCKCLRCREVGHQDEVKNQKSKIKNSIQKLKLFTDKYQASGGTEYFLSFCARGASALGGEHDVVFAFCRLRITRSVIPSVAEGSLSCGSFPPEAGPPLAERDSSTSLRFAQNDKQDLYPAFIRELHTYGQLVEINKTKKGASQHMGLGRCLMQEAERICKKSKINKIAVIAGVGVREYYRKLGYRLENTYMIKNL